MDTAKHTQHPRTALVAGPTGLVGSALIRRLLAVPTAGPVLAVSRRPLSDHPQLTVLPVPDGGALQLPVAVDDFYCALGTTLKRAGSRQAFRAIDVDLVIALAKAARSAGAQRAVVVSAIGANPRSTSFYLRCKGEMEAAVATLGFHSLHFMQPSLLMGERTEHRWGEGVAQRLAPLYAPLLVGGLSRYRPVSGETVAARMQTVMATAAPGVHRHTFGTAQRLSSSG